MIALVRLRGGIDGIDTNRHVKRVVEWADTLHATTHNSPLQLETVHHIAQWEIQPLMDIVKQHGYPRVAQRDVVPAYFRKVLENLQVLATAKPLLMRKEIPNRQQLRLFFSRLLFVMERQILELEYTASSTSVVGYFSSIEAVKAAVLIFTFHDLRDIAITAAFFDSLILRLREGLCGLCKHFSKIDNSAYIPDEAVAAPFLLWLCLNGWRASAIKTRQTDREFFVEKAALLCKSAGINSLGELGSQMCRIVFFADDCLIICRGLWEEINTWTNSHGMEKS